MRRVRRALENISVQSVWLRFQFWPLSFFTLNVATPRLLFSLSFDFS